MHPRCTLYLALALLHGAAVAAATAPADSPQQPTARVLRLGGFEVAPMLIGKPNEPIGGVLPEFVAREIAPHLQARFIWMPATSYARALQSLRDGSLDILLSDIREAEHPPDIGRFDWDYLEASPCLAVATSSLLLEVHDLHELGGMTIAWVAGPALPPELRSLQIKWHWPSMQNWQSTNLRMLSMGRIDAAYFANPYSPAYVARKQGLAIRLVTLPLPPTHFTMFYSVHADPALIQAFDALASQAFKGERFRRALEQYEE